MIASLHDIAHALGGEVAGNEVLAPGPGHGPRDRSLCVRLSSKSPDGFVVHSFAGDDFGACRDHVSSRLGMTGRKGKGAATGHAKASDSEVPPEVRIERAIKLWNGAVDPHGTIAEIYLLGRGLKLRDQGVAGRVLRFHPRCPWRDEDRNETIFVPAMVAAMRSVTTGLITAVHRTRLSPEGHKVDRRMLGIAAGAAIKLDPDETVTIGLAIGEGIETCLAARQLGIQPVWATGSTSFLAAFPVQAGIEALRLLAENDAASEHAVQTCAARWHRAGKKIRIVRPKAGKDLNDSLRGAA